MAKLKVIINIEGVDPTRFDPSNVMDWMMDEQNFEQNARAFGGLDPDSVSFEAMEGEWVD